LDLEATHLTLRSPSLAYLRKNMEVMGPRAGKDSAEGAGCSTVMFLEPYNPRDPMVQKVSAAEKYVVWISW
jgi:hypothetical protein